LTAVYAGAALQLSGARGGLTEFKLDNKIANLEANYGTYILAASSATERAVEREKDGHGIFTKALLDGLKQHSQETLTIVALNSYVCKALTYTPQTPRMTALEQGGEPIEIANFKHLFDERRQQQLRLLVDKAAVLLGTYADVFGETPLESKPGRVTKKLLMEVATALGKVRRSYYAPDIPSKLFYTRTITKFPPDEEMLILFDCSLFGNVKTCVSIGESGVYFSSLGFVPWEKALESPVEVVADRGGQLKIGDKYWNIGNARVRHVEKFLLSLRTRLITTRRDLH
jgi:hypothetical protein